MKSFAGVVFSIEDATSENFIRMVASRIQETISEDLPWVTGNGQPLNCMDILIRHACSTDTYGILRELEHVLSRDKTSAESSKQVYTREILDTKWKSIQYSD